MKRHYQEGTTKNDIELFVNMIMATFVGEDFTKVFNHCGYYFSGFVPDKALHSESMKTMGFASIIEGDQD